MGKIRKIIENIEGYNLNFSGWILGFSAIISVRMLGENLLSKFEGKSFDFFVGSTLAAYLFFLFSFVIIIIFVAWWIKEPLKKVANILLFGFFIVILPPLLDRVLCGAEKCWSFYAFDSFRGLIERFFTFFGDSPAVGITYGVRIEVALAVLFLMIYMYLKTRRMGKSLTGGLISYAILFVLGTFPAWLTFLFLAPSKGIFGIQGFDVAGLFLSPAHYFSFSSGDIVNALNIKMNLIYAFLISAAIAAFFWLFFRKKFWPVVKNIRWVQIMIHAGLVLFGAALGAFYFPDNLTIDIFSFFALANLVLAAVFAWCSSVFLNDREDLEIDKVTNLRRPLVTGALESEDYRQLFWVSFVLSLILSISVGTKFFLVILVYQVIGWIYSAWPFRLKRFVGVASFLSALALTLIFIGGFMLLSDNQNFSQLPSEIFWLLVIAFTFSLPVKDLKDIEGDKKNGIFTVPVLLGETWARFGIGLGIFVSYALSVVWLNAKILFFPAMILGAASFWMIQNKKISTRRVHIWVFGFLFVYVFMMAYFIFWPVLKFGHI